MQAILTTEQLRTMNRFDLIATWLVVVTSRKAGREDTGGLKVSKAGAAYKVTMPGVGDGNAILFAGDASRLYDYARRTALNAQIRVVEHARIQSLVAV